MACNKNEILKNVRDKHNLTMAQIKLLESLMKDVVEDLRLGDEAVKSSSKDDVYEYIVDSYESTKKDFIAELNKEKPKIQNTKSESTGYVVPITIERIVGRTAYYTYKDANKVYQIPANSKFIKLDNVDLDTRIREFAHVAATYGNTQGANKAWNSFEDIEKNIHKDPERMVALLEELHEADGKKESDEHMSQLRTLFSTLRSDFFTKMDVYVSKDVEGRGGIASNTKIGVYFSNVAKQANNEMGAAEIYAHEIVHAITQFSLESASINREAAKLVKELDYLMESVMDRLTWKELMPKESIDAVREERIAKELYQYIFTNKEARAEFIAHALTNPILSEKLKLMNLKPKHETKNILEVLVDWFTSLVDLIMGNYEFNDSKKTAYEQAMKLTMALAEINNNKLNEVKQKNIVNTITDGIQSGNEMIGEAIDKVINKFKDENITIANLPANATLAERIPWTAKALWVIMNNKEYRNYFGHVMSAWGVTPEGMLRDWGRAFMETNEMQKAVEWLGTTSDKIDQARNRVILEAKKLVLDGFGETKLSETEEEALTAILVDTDIQSIFFDKQYTNKKIRSMLEDDAELEKQLNWAKSRLEDMDSVHRHWHINQAHVLGVYMATGEISTGMNFNSWNIARGLQSSEIKKVKGNRGRLLMKEIDTVATLTALKYSNKEQKKQVAELMRVEWGRRGVKNLVHIHKGFIDDSKATLFEGNTTQMIKGYSKEIFDDKITMEIAPISEQSAMEARGYELKEELLKNGADRSVPMGIYVATTFVTNERLRAATRMTRMGVKGTSITDIYFKEGSTLAQKKIELAKIRLDRERTKVLKSMEEGTYVYNANDNVVMAPIMDEFGNVTDYRYMMNKASKKKYLGQDTKVSDVLARSFGNSIDKAGTNEHNKRVLDHILEVMKEDWIPGSTVGKTGMEYILIGPKATNKEAQEIYAVLPPSFKNAIKKHPQETLAVPRYLMHMYFGYRHLSIVDFPGLKYITPAFIQGLIRMAETMWIEAIKVLKGSILMKMPFILVGNIVSNVVYAIMTGEVNPKTLFMDYKQSFADIRKYIKNNREISRLEIKETSKTIKPDEKNRLAMLRTQNSKSPIDELMQIGLYQAVAEDVEAMDVESTNKWKQIIDEKLKPMPTFVKTPLQWMYLSSETSWYKVNQEVLQMSDLIARDVENRRRKRMEIRQASGDRPLPSWWVDKHGNAKLTTQKQKAAFFKEAEAIRHYSLLENYVNYNKPASRLEEYLNRVGAIMFTKYTKNIQRVIATSTYKYPINALALLLGQEYLVDVETIQDQAFFTRSWFNFGYGPGDVLPFHSPLDQIMEIITPAVLKPETLTFIP